MRTATDRITWRNGFRLNGEPADLIDLQELYEANVYARKLEIYEKRKAEIRDNCVSSADYEYACQCLAEMLGI